MYKRITALVLLLLSLHALTAEEKPLITVFDFQYSEAFSEDDMTSLIYLLSSELFKTGKFTVIDIQERNSLLREAGYMDEEKPKPKEEILLEIGTMLEADFIITGRIGTVGNRLVLNANMLETGTARIVKTADGLYETVDELMADLQTIAITLAAEKEEIRVIDETTMEDFASQDLVDKTEEGSEEPEIIDINGFEDLEVNNGINKKGLGLMTLSAGVAMAGTGTWFLLDSLEKIENVKTAADAYLNASDSFDYYYDQYKNAYYEAENSKTLFFAGTGLIGGGVISSLISIVLFTGDSDNSSLSLQMLPGKERTAVQLGFSY